MKLPDDAGWLKTPASATQLQLERLAKKISSSLSSTAKIMQMVEQYGELLNYS